jgi:signal transduction histidine kinase
MGIAIGLALRTTIRAEIDVWGPHFAMMKSMMGNAPDLTQLNADVDHALVLGLLVAFTLAIVVGALFGRFLTASIARIEAGLAQFAHGRLTSRIDEGRGPSELRRIATSANRMAAAIETARGAERELVAGLAHDLAHPLTALRGSLEATRDTLRPPIDGTAAQQLLKDVDALDETLRDLRDVAAVEAGAIRLDIREVELVAAIHSMHARYVEAAAARGIALVVSGDESVIVYTDHRRLERIVANLLVNALAASPPQSTVELGVRRELRTGRGILHVRDDAGSEATERLSVALLGGDGRGLGLRVVTSLVQALGAAISVVGTSSGSQVEVRLQLSNPPHPLHTHVVTSGP